MQAMTRSSTRPNASPFFGDAEQPPLTEEPLEPPIQRPIRVGVVRIGRVRELPRKPINVGVGQRQPITGVRGHFTSALASDLQDVAQGSPRRRVRG